MGSQKRNSSFGKFYIDAINCIKRKQATLIAEPSGSPRPSNFYCSGFLFKFQQGMTVSMEGKICPTGDKVAVPKFFN